MCPPFFVSGTHFERQKSPIEKRKRNSKTISPISRGEREIWIPSHQFWEEKEKLESLCLVSRVEREIQISFAQFREEKEKLEFLSKVLRGEREISNFLFPVSRGEREIGEKIFNFQDLRVPEMSLREAIIRKKILFYEKVS